MAEVKFQTRAYCKMLLHAAKYPHCAVNGLLLSEISKTKDSKKVQSLIITDVVPLFHISLHVCPMAEIALTQVDHWANSEGMVIAGYYIANENLRDTSIDKPANKIADKIAENFDSACLVVIDNRHVTLTMEAPAIIVSQYSDAKWNTLKDSSWSLEDGSQDMVSNLFERHWQEDLVDFDNHLDNLAFDWRNKPTNTVIDDFSNQ